MSTNRSLVATYRANILQGLKGFIEPYSLKRGMYRRIWTKAVWCNFIAYKWIFVFFLQYFIFWLLDFSFINLLADLGKVRGCFTNTSMIKRLTDWVLDGTSCHELDYLNKFKEKLYHKGHQNFKSGSKVTHKCLAPFYLALELSLLLGPVQNHNLPVICGTSGT